MHPASKKCVVAAVILLVLGLTLSYLWEYLLGPGMTGLWGSAGGYAGPSPDLFLMLTGLSPIISAVERLAFTCGAVLIGAAVVVQVLAPRIEAAAQAAQAAAEVPAEEAEPSDDAEQWQAGEQARPKQTYDPRNYQP